MGANLGKQPGAEVGARPENHGDSWIFLASAQLGRHTVAVCLFRSRKGKDDTCLDECATTGFCLRFARAAEGQPSGGGSRRGRFPFSRRLHIEPLENRRLLSITVDTLLDEHDGSIVDGDISLRDAIAAAASGETIDFGVIGLIELTLGELVIDKDLTIIGPPGSSGTPVSYPKLPIFAYGSDPTPFVRNGDGNRVFNVDDGNDANLIDVEIVDPESFARRRGGRRQTIRNRERLTIRDSIISNGAAPVWRRRRQRRWRFDNRELPDH